MTEFVGDWLHFDSRQPKRKRAELVCTPCHAKKVKCDLQTKTSEGHSTCSGCYAAGTDCHVRLSKRKKGSHHHSISSAREKETRPRSPSPSSPSSSRADVVIAALPPPPPASLTAPPPAPAPPPPPSAPPSPTTELLIGVATGRSNPSDLDTGFLNVYGPETNADAEQQELEATLEYGYSLSDSRQQELQQIYADTYVEFCYPWAPVLDVDRISEDTLRSPLLANALAVAGSHIRPPLIPHDGPAAYYKRATAIFYNDEEAGGLTTLQALSLFYWWAPRSISVAHRHSSWWWTSVLIRHAQQMNLHRELGPSHPMRDLLQLSLRRRIWWTAFARERLTALCQSKPCIIDPTDCSIAPPTLSDFPPVPHLQRKGEVFIHWVSLCAIIGRVAKFLARPGDAFPTHLRTELVEWVRALPPHLQLPISNARTDSDTFDRDVHQLHLPYLTTIIVLHLRRTAHDLPQALPPAILAASCIVRILRDILSRGDARFLMAITCWYSGTAFTALLQACRIPALARDANEGLDVLTTAVDQLQRMWGSAKVIRQGFDRLRGGGAGGGGGGAHGGRLEFELGGAADGSVQEELGGVGRDFDWTALFPFVTPATGGIAKALLQGSEQGMTTRFPSPEGLLFQDAFMVDYRGLLEPFSQGDLFGFGPVGLGM
ncbi:hypothetical protein C8A05DRAFT_17022 [Staphylotrichum tortipilum]|uniref:Zn(2)-C6 fungal-type domain-containing protein n=1 Tax=Staphylotrichum tortipilum TaxID=2831512 RepID=A0AAN6MIU5_9PEZI|nr:hypothetical protein C8A05DRAFT_17022 [Staphylotrichum longicolle]